MKKISIIGSGNWGSAIAKIVGVNVNKNSNFERKIPMYVFEEIINGQKLTEIINTTHENVKYLPGFKLPENIVAIPDVIEAVRDADILIFVMPHQFIEGICHTIKSHIKASASALHLIKGLAFKGEGVDLISNVIREQLNIPCSVLMGANIADEVAKENFCEATIGCKDAARGSELKSLFQTSYFRINIVPDEVAVELCGALKNVVAVGAGIVDGLGLGANTKAAIIRIGFKEMIKFCNNIFFESSTDTFLESCGFADVIATCYSGRNRRMAEEFVRSGGQKSFAQLEKEFLNGQLLQGPPTAAEVFYVLKNRNLLDEYPLFVAIHQICTAEIQPSGLILSVNHP